MNYWQNLSKFLYDLAKITFAGLVIGSIVSPKGAKPSNVILGIILTVLPGVAAFWLDRWKGGK